MYSADGWQLGAPTFGAMLPNRTNGVRLTGKRTPSGGPIPYINIAWGENDLALAKRMLESFEFLLEGYDKTLEPRTSSPGTAKHEVGTCRMGLDPRSSMLDG